MFIWLEIVQLPVALETFTQPCKGCQWLRKPEESFSISFFALWLFALLFPLAAFFEEQRASNGPYLILLVSPQGSKSQHCIPWPPKKTTDLDKCHAVCIQFSRCWKISITSSFPSLWAGINYEPSSRDYSNPSEASSFLTWWLCPNGIARVPTLSLFIQLC